ncbi:PAC2 family protein [Candidatus Woesearchaeota archaeon]|nr:PAC2 family protein [Candidatus Woesearchaeota archaeon]
MTWKFEPLTKEKPKIKNSVLIVGLPGIGNVGKIAADFIIDEVKAKPLYNIFSHELPNSVFVNDQNLVELPSVELYWKKRNGKPDILVLTGDVQPAEESSSYDFCEGILEVAQKLGVGMVITLGGIGLADVPKKPQVFCTGNSKDAIKRFSKSLSLNDKLYGIVGPIIGVSGLMVGLAERRKMPAVCLLAETLGHPAYLGIKGAREIVKVLSKKLDLKIKISELDKEIEDIEEEILTRTQELSKASKKAALKKLQGRMQKETSYIG